MLYKRITRHFADPREGTPPATLLKVASATGRVDRSQMQKLSGMGMTPLLDGITPSPGCSLLHVIAVGEHGMWGPNSNADSFNKTAMRVKPLDPASAKKPYVDLRSGLVEKHRTYEKEGGLYFEHFNRTKGAKKQGLIKKAVYNDRMGRVELAIEVEDAKHGPLLESVERGDPTFVSQGCSVPEDVCSACLNQAKSPRDYCDHMKRHKLEMLEGGGRVFCYNPDPTFHDISVVKVPAFIPAFVLGMRKGQEKAASARPCGPQVLECTYGAGDFVKAAGIDIPATAVASYLMDARPRKMELLAKLAKLEKEIPGQVVDAVVAGSRLAPEKRRKLAAVASSKSPAELVSMAKAAGLVLPSTLFHDILVAENPQECVDDGGYRRALRSVFSDLMDDPDALLEVVDNDDYRSDRPCTDKGGLEEFAEELSPDPGKALGLSEKAMLSGDGHSECHADSEPDDGDKAMAREYARYLLSALDGKPDAALKVVVIRKGRE